MPDPKRRFRSAAQIRKILNELEESGLSQRRFALDHNLPLSTLQSWLLKQRSAGTVARDMPDVIPIGTVSGPPPLMEIELAGGEILRLGSGFRGQDLKTVLEELRRC